MRFLGRVFCKIWFRSLKPDLSVQQMTQIPLIQKCSRSIFRSISTKSLGIQNADLQTSDKEILQQVVRFPLRVPLLTKLPDGEEAVVDFMTDGQISETYAMIQEAGKNEMGFVENEFSSETIFRQEFQRAFPFAVTKRASDKLIAGIIIFRSSFCRGTKVADALCIVDKSEREKGVGNFCLQIMETFTADLGFVAIYADCYSNNKVMLRSLGRIGGYIRCGYLPMGGQMTDGSYISSIIFYKDLRHSINTEPRVSCHCMLEDCLQN